MNAPIRTALLAMSWVLLHLATSVQAQDVFVKYFDNATGLSGSPIGGFTYDAANNRFITAGFSGSGQSINSVDSSSGSFNSLTYNSGTGQWQTAGAPVATPLIQATDWARYITSTSLTNNGGNGTTNFGNWSGTSVVGDIKLNPASLTIGGTTYAPGTIAIVNDSDSPLSQPGNVAQPAAAKVVYAFDLRPDFSTNTGRDWNGNGVVNWNDQFDNIVSRADMQSVAGSTSNTFNLARSFAFSSNGKSIYINDSTAGPYGGIWQVNLESSGPSALTHLVSTTTSPAINTEPTVIPTSTRVLNAADGQSGDQILFQTSALNGDTSSSQGGIAYVIRGATTTSSVKTLISASTLQNFLEKSSSSILSTTSDSAGNLYFYESQGGGLYEYDTQGRIIKVAGLTQRNNFQLAQSGGSTNNSVLDLQATTTTVTNGANTFSVPEVLYSDASAGLKTVVGALNFKPGDFNRDNVVDSSDLTLFKSALSTRGTSTSTANLKYDLNGNGVVDWKDVKVLQQFVGFKDGDANMDGAVNFTDLNTMRDHYYTLSGQTANTWATGDFASSDPNYAATAVDANLVNLTDLNVIANIWRNVLSQTQITWDQLDSNGYAGQFRTDVITAFSMKFLADMNGDALVNNFDISAFELALTNPGAYLSLYPTRSDYAARGDINGDNAFNNFDIASFETYLTGNPSAPVPEPSTLLLLAPAAAGLAATGYLSSRRRRKELCDAAE